jgi:hypothetical protein
MRRVLFRAVIALGAFAVSTPTARAQTATGRIDGVVFDSVYARPLARASVQLALAANVSVTRTLTADDAGRFHADSLEPGAWLIGAVHPWLDSLSIMQLSQGVMVAARGSTRATIAVPSARALITHVCGDSFARDSSGFLFGTLRTSRQPRTHTAGSVQVQWQEIAITKGGYERTLPVQTARADSSGSYSLCGIPAGGTLRVQAWNAADSSGVLEVVVPLHGIARLDLAVGSARQISTTLPDTRDSAAARNSDTTAAPPLTVSLLRGTGSVRGVTQTVTSKPLSGATVSMWGTGIEVLTDSLGRFSMAELPTGSRTLEIRAIGYAPLRTLVDVMDDDATTISAQLDRVTDLTPIQIQALRSSILGADLAGFDKRRKGAIGRFLDGDQVSKLHIFRTVDVFRNVPGARVVPGKDGDRVVFHSEGRGWCSPTIYVNGMISPGPGDLDLFVNSSSIAGVEIYTNWVLTPSEFAPMGPCGSVVFWTKPRVGRSK